MSQATKQNCTLINKIYGPDPPQLSGVGFLALASPTVVNRRLNQTKPTEGARERSVLQSLQLDFVHSRSGEITLDQAPRRVAWGARDPSYVGTAAFGPLSETPG